MFGCIYIYMEENNRNKSDSIPLHLEILNIIVCANHVIVFQKKNTDWMAIWSFFVYIVSLSFCYFIKTSIAVLATFPLKGRGCRILGIWIQSKSDDEVIHIVVEWPTFGKVSQRSSEAWTSID